MLMAAYRGQSAELPSSDLDERLRAAARRAVGARPRTPGRFRLGSWSVPLAAAATVVLSSSLVFMTLRERGLEETQSPGLREPGSAPTASAWPQTADGASTAVPAGGDRRTAAPEQAVAGAQAPASVGGFDAARVSPRTVEARKPAAMGREPVPRQRKTEVTAPASPDVAGDTVPGQGPPVIAPAPEADAPAAALVLPGAPIEEERSETGQSGSTAASGESPRRSARSDGAAAAHGPLQSLAKSAAPAAVASGALAAKLERQVESIRRALRDGRRSQALEQLAALRRTHPDYVLPADLLELARELPEPSR